MERPSLKEYFLQMLDLVSSRSTCARRRVGTIITNNEGHVLSMGYNGVPRNFQHCIDVPCVGTLDQPGNTDNCMAIHSEQNALLQCRNIDRAYTMYCSCLPCFICSKMIANTNITQIICKEDYADRRGLVVLIEAGMIVEIAGKMYGMEEDNE